MFLPVRNCAVKQTLHLIRFHHGSSLPRFVWTWSGSSTSSPSLLWAPSPCWTSSPGSLSPCPASWSSRTWTTPAPRRPPVGAMPTAPCSSLTGTSPCPARLGACARAWMRRGTFTTPIGKKKERQVYWVMDVGRSGRHMDDSLNTGRADTLTVVRQ